MPHEDLRDDLTIDLNLVRESVRDVWDTLITRVPFVAVSHVHYIIFQSEEDGFPGLTAHPGDTHHPEWWEILFRPDDGGNGDWSIFANFTFEGNADAMERDVAVLMLTGFEQDIPEPSSNTV